MGKREEAQSTQHIAIKKEKTADVTGNLTEDPVSNDDDASSSDVSDSAVNLLKRGTTMIGGRNS